MKNKATLRPARLAVALAGAMVLAGPAWAASIATSPDPASIPLTGSTDVAIVYTSSAGVNAFSGGLSYDTTQFDATAVGATGVTCSVNDGFSGTEGRVAVAAFSLGGDLPSQTLCTVTFTTAGATEGDYPLTFVTPVFGGSGGGDTVDDGLLQVQAAPPVAPSVAFNPDGGTINIPSGGGNVGQASGSAAIAVTASGGSGAGTASYSCTVPGGFTVTNSSNASITVGSDPADMSVSCTLGINPSSAAMPCDVTDAGGTRTENFTLSCPAGNPVPAPLFSSTPPAGSTITCNGAAGAVVNRTIVIENAGIPGAGSELDYTCTISGTGFAFVSGQSGSVAVDDTADLQFSCTVPATEGVTNTGTISCTSDGGDADFDLSSGIVTAPPPVPQPAIIPTNSLWSLLGLFGLMAGIGAVVVGLRRH